VVVIFCTTAVYAATYYLLVATSVGMGKVGLSAEIPVLWSLNFLWANLVAMAFRKSINGVGSFASLLSHPMVDRVVAVLADVLIATAVMAIGLTLAPSYILPLIVACVLGAIITYVIVRDTTRWAFKDHAFTRFAGLFGEQTGTFSSGLALIRMVDPGYQTPVARDQVLGSGTALILGFPLLLLINLPLTRFGGSGTGYAIVAGLLSVYLVATIFAWRAVHRRFN
jgi:ESS family glutamate:Na+ symporter